MPHVCRAGAFGAAGLAGHGAAAVRGDRIGRRSDRHRTAPPGELSGGVHRRPGAGGKSAGCRRQHCRHDRGEGGARRPYAVVDRLEPVRQSDAAAQSRLRLRARPRAGVDDGRGENAARRGAVVCRRKHHRRHRHGEAKAEVCEHRDIDDRHAQSSRRRDARPIRQYRSHLRALRWDRPGHTRPGRRPGRLGGRRHAVAAASGPRRGVEGAGGDIGATFADRTRNTDRGGSGTARTADRRLDLFHGNRRHAGPDRGAAGRGNRQGAGRAGSPRRLRQARRRNLPHGPASARRISARRSEPFRRPPRPLARQGREP